MLCGLCIVLGFHALARLHSGATEFHAPPVLVVGILGLVINLASAWLLARSDRTNLNVRGALAHMLADALGSVAAIAAAIAATQFNFHAADPILSLLICALILYGTWGVLRDATRVLLDFVPQNLTLDRIHGRLLALPGVQAVHELHVWGTGNRTLLTGPQVHPPPPRPPPQQRAAGQGRPPPV